MRTKQDGAPNAFEPYEQEEVNLILTLTPTYANVKNLAKSLGRTEDAITLIYRQAYRSKWLKKDINDMKDTQENIATKIARSKKELGIII